MSRLLIIFVSVCLALAVGDQARYDNYRVYKVTANDVDQLAVLKDLDGATDSMIFLDGVHALSKGVHVVVAPHKVPDFVSILTTKGITHELVEEDAQSRLDSVDLGFEARSGYGWTSYHTLEENYEWLKSLAKTYPKVVSLIVGGKSYEGRQILGIKISHKSGNKGVFIEGGIHAREWIAPATVTYLINQLLTSTSPAIKNIAQNNDWYIFPHANPDGYAYTWSKDRMWRKTRRPYGSCYGADPNRNWNFHWNEVGSSNNACSDTYAGPSANSEIEVKTLSSYIASLKGKIHLYISFHAYSQYLLYPYGHTSQLPPNANDLKTVYNAAVDAMNKRYGTKYTGGNIYDAIYPASGASIDWAYANVDTKLAFCYELRPSSNSVWYGFQLPASQIVPTGEETIDSIVAMVGKAKQLKYLFKFQEKYHPQLAASSAVELADKLLAFGGLLLYPFDAYLTINEELQNLNDLLVYKYGNGTYPTRSIIRRLAPKCEDLVKRCVLKGQNLNCKEVFFMRTTTSGVCCLFNYRRVSYTDDREIHEKDEHAINKSNKIHFDQSGFLSSLQLVLQDDPDDYTLKEYPSDVFRVLLFYPENYPDTEIGSVIRNLIGYNEETEISIQPEILEGSDRMKQFSSKMRHCYFLEEGQQLLKQKYYSFSECILNCRTLSVVNHCGCVVPVLPGFIEGVPYCVLIDLPCIALWKSIWWQWNAFDYVSEKRQPQPTLELCNHCLPSCDIVSYEATVNSRPLNVPPNGANYSAGILNGFSPSKPTTAIRFFYQSAFSQVKTHDISGDWVVLLGRYGGICSVMYGFSIVAIIELLYFATGKWFVLWWKACVQCYRNRQLLRKVESAKHQDLYWNELKPKRPFRMRELNDF